MELCELKDVMVGFVECLIDVRKKSLSACLMIRLSIDYAHMHLGSRVEAGVQRRRDFVY